MKQVIEEKAYLTMILHACKYPARPVLGVLLGKPGGSISVAIPLFHSYPLAPMLEMGMLQVEEYTKAAGLDIVGCYFANELYDDKSLNRSHMAVKLATKIAETCSEEVDACMLQIDNARLGSEAKSCIETYRWRGGSWRASQAEAVSVSAELLATAVAAVRDGKEAPLVDFEQHLDEPACRWLPTA